MMSPSNSKSSEAQAAIVVEDLTGGVTANVPFSDTDTSTTAQGAAAGALSSNEPVEALERHSAAAHPHSDEAIEPARLSDDQKPDLTDERAPTSTETYPSIGFRERSKSSVRSTTKFWQSTEQKVEHDTHEFCLVSYGRACV